MLENKSPAKSSPEAGAAVRTRWLEKSDVEWVVACEKATYGYEDPEFGVRQIPPHTWTGKDLRRTFKRSFAEPVRMRVCEITTEELSVDGLVMELPWVCGSYAYEIQKDGYNVILLTAHPDAPNAVVESAIADLKVRMKKNGRSKLTATVPDGNYRILKALQDSGFACKLVPSKTGTDSWLCEFSPVRRRSSPQKTKPNKEKA